MGVVGQGIIRGSDDIKALCCVDDSAKGTHVSFYYPLNELVIGLFEEIGRRLEYPSEQLLLTLNTFSKLVVLNDHKSKTLKQAGFVGKDQQKITLAIVSSLKLTEGKTKIEEKKMGALTAASPLNKNDDDPLNADQLSPVTNHNVSPLPLPNVSNIKLTNQNETHVVSNDAISELSFTNKDCPLSSNPSVAGDLAPPPEPPPPPPVILQETRFPAVTYPTEVPSCSTIPFVGLVNQAMTCYLNSLLQALYMTPEFRNALYHWEFEGSHADETTSIPYQLQKLFLNLQTSNRNAVETTALTKSFGWQSSDAWHQHDIQELCRVMFDALERKFQKTDEADLINRLYEGTMIDYVKCLECSNEKHREDKFLDIPLPVRPFGSAVAYESVEEALRAFVQPETLDGNNQYHCDVCQKKCNAHKGLKFTKFPYLLTLHLKRFDFDYSTLNRIKLNDKVAFPNFLNLNGLIISESISESLAENIEEIVKCDDSSTTDSGSALDEDNAVDTPTRVPTNHTEYQDDDEGIDISHTQEAEKNVLNSAASDLPGPYKYELFSIMIHSGSASGGHYYAYIKDFNHGEWYCFNDQSVCRITPDDIVKTYGGGRGYYSGAYSLSTNAYMLMYRQIDKIRNSTAMTAEEFPPHIHKLLKRIEEQKELDTKNREREEKLARYKLHVQMPGEPMKELRFVTSRDSTLLEATREAYQYVNLEDRVPFEQCRLVLYDVGKKCTVHSFDASDDNTCLDLLIIDPHKCNLLLEIRSKNAEFETYRPGDIITKVAIINAENRGIKDFLSVKTNLHETCKEYKIAVANALQTTPDKLHLFLEKHDEPKLVESSDELIKSVGFYLNCRVYAGYCENIELEHFQSIAKESKHIVTLHVTLPTVTKETLEEHNIPLTEYRIDDVNGDHEWEKDLDRDQIRDMSPQPEDLLAGAHSDQSASEDSSVTDGDRTIVGDPPEHSPDVSPLNWEQNNSSPENEKEEVDSRVLSWTKDAMGGGESHRDYCYSYDEGSPHYFRAMPFNDASSSTLRIILDKRITLKKLKEHLQRIVLVPVDYFKVYRVGNGKDSECLRPDETFTMLGEEDCLIVRLGRALRKGEHAGKVYLLDLENVEEERFLIEWVIAEGAKVSSVKKEIVGEVRSKCGLDIPYESCRLRRKKWNDPSKPYLDNSNFNDITASWDLYLQRLDGPDPITSEDQSLLLVRQWCPSTLQLRPPFELVLNSRHISELIEKIVQVSNIAVENIEIAVSNGRLPAGDIPARMIRLKWSQDSNELTEVPLLKNDDYDPVIIFRDRTEELKGGLSESEQRDLMKPIEHKRVRQNCTQKRERALKIYVDGSPPSASNHRSNHWDDEPPN